MYQARDEILKTSVNDFQSFAGKLDQVKNNGVTVVFGPNAALEQANTEIKDEKQKLAIEPAFLK